MPIIYIFSVRVNFGLFSEKETRRLQNLNGFCWQHEMKYLWNFSKLDVCFVILFTTRWPATRVTFEIIISCQKMNGSKRIRLHKQRFASMTNIKMVHRWPQLATLFRRSFGSTWFALCEFLSDLSEEIKCIKVIKTIVFNSDS